MWYKMLLFGLQDIAVKAKFAKWEALVQNGTFISACLLYTGGVFSGLSHSQRWWDTFVNCGKFGLPNLSLLLLHLERKLLSHRSEMSRLWEQLLREWKGHLVTKPVYLQLFTWAVFLCFQIFSEVTSKLTDSRNNDVGIISMKEKTNIFYDSITPDPLYSIWLQEKDQVWMSFCWCLWGVIITQASLVTLFAA